MKTGKLASAMIIAGLGIGVIVGCGGGGGSGGGGSIASTMNDETAAAWAANLSKIQGCNEVNISLAPAISRSVARYSWDISGPCGGSINISYDHENGITTYGYDMDSACLPVRSKDVSLTGKATLVEHGKPSPSGPIVSHDTAATNGRINASVVDGSRTEPETFSMAFSGLTQTYGSGNKNNPGTEARPDTMTISSADIIDSLGKKYAVSALSGKNYPVSDGLIFKTVSATYTDPTEGTFTVKAENIKILTNGQSIIPGVPGGIPEAVDGTVDLTATDGTKGSIKFENEIIYIYVDDENGTHESARIDCSDI
ncbi:MAG: hypothetical protein B5M52_01780 [Helicobacteraceae bacterium 4484_230]|nr:MAG: hypothetical protein B5M52_01780 [Helicobacteraceae bacterium 4484_230]